MYLIHDLPFLGGCLLAGACSSMPRPPLFDLFRSGKKFIDQHQRLFQGVKAVFVALVPPPPPPIDPHPVILGPIVSIVEWWMRMYGSFMRVPVVPPLMRKIQLNP
jgi:hypothetical protein